VSAGQRPIERMAIALVAITVCLVALADVLPRVLPALVALGVLAGLLRLVFFHTRKW